MSEIDHEKEYNAYINDQEAKFKAQKFYFSFSSLVKLMLDPRKFYKEYILGEREKLSAKFLDIGSLLHCLVLEPENYDEKFVVMPKKVPGGKIKSVLDKVYKTYGNIKVKENPNLIFHLDDFKDEIIEELKSADLYQGLVDNTKLVKGVLLSKKDKQLEKVFTPENTQYFDVLIEGSKRIIVDMDMNLKAHEKAKAILANPKAMELLTEKSKKQEVRMELELKSEFNDKYPFGLKGILDCVKIDYENATIHIVDLKTTSKTLQAWAESFMTSEYNYWLQPIVYKELILGMIPKTSKDKWTMKIHYVVVDGNNQVYCYPVSAESLVKWERMAVGAYDIGKWHLDNHNFKLPYNYAKNLVEL